MSHDRLSAQDSSFVFGETERVPLHVGSLCIVEGAPLRGEDGGIDIGRLRAKVGERLHLIPRFRQMLAEVPLDQGRPVWTDDPDFDIANHVHLAAVPAPGTRDQLLDLTAEIQGTMMDRDMPLWDIWVVDGLAGGEVGVVARVHHSMLDGASGMELGTLMFDVTPDGTPGGTPMERVAWEPAPLPSRVELVGEALADRTQQHRETLLSMLRAATHPGRIARDLVQFGDAMRVLFTDVDPLPFNAKVSPRRSFRTTMVPLDDVLDVKRRLGVTVNDLVIGAIAGALRTYCEHHDVDVDHLGRTAVLCPVDVRMGDDKELGNKVSTLVVDLPVNEAGPRARVDRVAESTKALKESGFAEAANHWNDANAHLPTTLIRLSSRIQFGGWMPKVNLLVSNVRGPDFPLYVLGAELTEMYPYLGLLDNCGLSIMVFSYGGKMCIGVVSDPELMPDIGVLAGALTTTFTDLGSLV